MTPYIYTLILSSLVSRSVKHFYSAGGHRPVVSPPLHISHRDELRTFTHDLLPFLHPGSMSPETGVRGGESVVHRHVGKNRTFSKIALNKEAVSYTVDTLI